VNRDLKLKKKKKFGSHNRITEQNNIHRTAELLRLESTSGDHPVYPVVLRVGQLQQIFQGYFWLSFEYLQGQTLDNLSGQPIPVFDCPYNKNLFSYV